ncbi:MAG: outer membrane beta-barrel protein [Pseudomonadales bacterium]|nr:outer membrane beta-barrel protein [Pseudomonadales bacterium]
MKMQTRFLIKKATVATILLLGFYSSFSFAAGPRPKDFYLNIGGGVFTPDFVLSKTAKLNGIEGVDGEDDITYIGISVPFVGVEQPLRLIGITADGDVGKNQPENRSILSLGGVLGYKYNRSVNFGVHLDLGFPNILIKDVHLANVLDSDIQSTGRVHILAPDLLPIGASVTYTFLPDALISPYVGAGALVALLHNRRVNHEATDILVIDGGVEFGYLVHAGAYVDLSNTWYGFADFKYASIDSPEFTTRQGTPAPVDRIDIRHIRVGAGIRF